MEIATVEQEYLRYATMTRPRSAPCKGRQRLSYLKLNRIMMMKRLLCSLKKRAASEKIKLEANRRVTVLGAAAWHTSIYPILTHSLYEFLELSLEFL